MRNKGNEFLSTGKLEWRLILPYPYHYDHRNPTPRNRTNSWKLSQISQGCWRSNSLVYYASNRSPERVNIVSCLVGYNNGRQKTWRETQRRKQTLQLWPNLLAHNQGCSWWKKHLGQCLSSPEYNINLTLPHWQIENNIGSFPVLLASLVIASAIRWYSRPRL